MKPVRHPRHVGSKWKKAQALLKNKELRTYIPETRIFNRANVLQMLEKYKMIYVKPVNGTFGNGVMRVELKSKGTAAVYRYQIEKTVKSFSTFDELYKSIQKRKFKRSYLVQQGIHLLTYKSRAFDLRIMVQRSSAKVWKTTAYIGRLAHPKKIVTNYHSEGKPMSVEILLSPYMKGAKMKNYIADLEKLGEDIANQLKKSFPGFREIGVDIAVDARLRPWILEVNTKPDPFIFNKLKDKSMYRRVLKYSRESGRFKRK